MSKVIKSKNAAKQKLSGINTFFENLFDLNGSN